MKSGKLFKIIYIIFFSFAFVTPTMADSTVQTKIATPTDCIKTFTIGFEELYYLTLAGTNKLNYKIKEMQTKGGFIIFTDNNNKTFLASVIYVSNGKSMLKIAPCDNTYNFTTSTPCNMFKYIEENQARTF